MTSKQTISIQSHAIFLPFMTLNKTGLIIIYSTVVSKIEKLFVQNASKAVGAKSHGRPTLPCRARSAAPYFYFPFSFNKTVLIIIYSTAVNEIEKLFVQNGVFIDKFKWVWSLRATAKQCRASLNHHISVMYMIFDHQLILK